MLLRMRPAEPGKVVAAVLLPGADPARWLEELSRWGMPLIGLRLYLIPESRRSRTPLGALVPLPTAPTHAPSASALRYQRLGAKLYLPLDARLDLESEPRELDGHIAGELAVFHPAIGLIVFERQDGLAVADLLAPPALRPVDWTCARPGVAQVARLLSVEPETCPTVDLVLREGRDDIGTESVEDLAGRDGDDSALGRAGKWVGDQVSKAVQWLSGAPATSSSGTGSGPAGGFREWLRKKGEEWNCKLDSLRNRELLRLMHLLESDPDRGLKFALPLNGNAGRGQAAPGATLPPRPIDFDLNRLRGGGAADAWNLPADMHRELRRRYHELASREIRLGRYRRAAYILAELLGEHLSAAATLAMGKHFREAAVLYRDHLKRPLEAAKCLEQGGLLTEAITLYESIGEWETAGDLYARLERRSEAVTAWRRAAVALKENGEWLGAARLLEMKVNAPDEALAVLAEAWPRAEQAGRCLRERFALLGRLTRHADAQQLLARLRGDALAPPGVRALAAALVAVAESYPEAGVRRLCGDVVRVVVGNQLAHSNAEETAELVRSITRLAPEDRLLARDGNRFADRRRAQLAPRPTPPTGKGEVALLRTFHLPSDVVWKTAGAQGRMFWAAGVGRRGIVVARSLWDGVLQTLTWECLAPSSARILLQPGAFVTHPTLLMLTGGPRLPLLRLEATESIPVATRVGTPPALPNRCLALGYGEHSSVWSLHETEDAGVLSSWTLDGHVIATHQVPALDGETAPGSSRPWGNATLLTRRDSVYLGFGRHLLALLRGQRFVPIELDDQVLDLAGSDPLSRPRIAATYEWGGSVVWGGSDWGEVRPFAERMWRPLAAFARDGSLVAIAQGEGHIYSTHNLAVAHRYTFACPEDNPMAVLPAAGLSEFALLGADGTVRIYRIPG